MLNKLTQAYRREFGRDPQVATRAPGRLEILGNHTDYNQGTVLSVAVDRETCVAAGTAPGTACRIVDIANDTFREFTITDLDHPAKGDWANYVKGLVVEFRKRGVEIPAFEMVLESTVPMSAGMSSSAALEMSAALALGKLAGADLPWRDYALIGQGSENNYVGAKTGLLDQFSSLKGKAGQLVFSDFRSLEVANVPLPPGTALVVANCMVKHNLTNEYNERREACEEAVRALQKRYPGIQALRDVSLEELEAAREYVPPLAFKRALHVVGEITRVNRGVESLERGELKAFGAAMFESQSSSTHNFENSCRELDILVDIARGLPGAIGARLSGGGFGGITVHLVEADAAYAYAAALEKAYKERTGLQADVMICQAADGAGILVD